MGHHPPLPWPKGQVDSICGYLLVVFGAHPFGSEAKSSETLNERVYRHRKIKDMSMLVSEIDIYIYMICIDMYIYKHDELVNIESIWMNNLHFLCWQPPKTMKNIRIFVQNGNFFPSTHPIPSMLYGIFTIHLWYLWWLFMVKIWVNVGWKIYELVPWILQIARSPRQSSPRCWRR